MACISSYSDVDTIIVNPLLSLEAFLPPPSEDPFIMATRDLDAFC